MAVSVTRSELGPEIAVIPDWDFAIDPLPERIDVEQVVRAYRFSEEAHRGQKRQSGEDYVLHCVAVAKILAGLNLDTTTVVAGLVHDVIEDTPVKLAENEARFGPEIAGLVDGVTKLTRLELQSDRTKQAENFRKLVLAMSREIRVLLVKLADRLHNMRTLHFVADPDRRRRIARETMEIYAPLAERIGMVRVKEELQTLAFAQLEPEAYDTIQARLNFLRGQGADGRAGWAGRVARTQGALLDGHEHGGGGQHLGHRREGERPGDVAGHGEHAVVPDHRSRGVGDGPAVERAAEQRGEVVDGDTLRGAHRLDGILSRSQPRSSPRSHACPSTTSTSRRSTGPAPTSTTTRGRRCWS